MQLTRDSSKHRNCASRCQGGSDQVRSPESDQVAVGTDGVAVFSAVFASGNDRVDDAHDSNDECSGELGISLYFQPLSNSLCS
jgi:hypothetical protein